MNVDDLLRRRGSASGGGRPRAPEAAHAGGFLALHRSGYSIEGAFNRELDLKRVANVLNMVGEVTINEEEGWCSIDWRNRVRGRGR